jgi:phytoene/squalene synthetase
VSESLRPGLDHHVAHSRLQWWREECERTANGNPVHPLARKLVSALEALPTTAPLPAHAHVAAPNSAHAPAPVPAHAPAPARLAGLTGFVDTAIWDLAGATFESRKELTAYCERWATAMIGPLVPASIAPPGNASAPQLPDWRGVGTALREI